MFFGTRRPDQLRSFPKIPAIPTHSACRRPGCRGGAAEPQPGGRVGEGLGVAVRAIGAEMRARRGRPLAACLLAISVGALAAADPAPAADAPASENSWTRWFNRGPVALGAGQGPSMVLNLNRTEPWTIHGWFYPTGVSGLHPSQELAIFQSRYVGGSL